MLILLDENIPHSLRKVLSGHDVRTTTFQGWAGLSNGALLRAAEAEGFDTLITADRGIDYQQNRAGQRIRLIVLTTNREESLRANVKAILHAIECASPGSSTLVDVR